jgi:hypothetical protein
LTEIDPFCHKQFKPCSKGKISIDFEMGEFEKKVNELYKAEDLRDGYAPFCKHIFIENFTEALVYY